MKTKFGEFLNEGWLIKNDQDRLVDKIIDIIEKNKNSLKIKYSKNKTTFTAKETYDLNIVKMQNLPNDPFEEDAEELGRLNIQIIRKVQDDILTSTISYEIFINGEQVYWSNSLLKKLFRYIERTDIEKRNLKAKQDLDKF